MYIYIYLYIYIYIYIYIYNYTMRSNGSTCDFCFLDGLQTLDNLQSFKFSWKPNIKVGHIW